MTSRFNENKRSRNGKNKNQLVFILFRIKSTLTSFKIHFGWFWKMPTSVIPFKETLIEAMNIILRSPAIFILNAYCKTDPKSTESHWILLLLSYGKDVGLDDDDRQLISQILGHLSNLFTSSIIEWLNEWTNEWQISFYTRHPWFTCHYLVFSKKTWRHSKTNYHLTSDILM